MVDSVNRSLHFFYFFIVATAPKLSRVGISSEPNPGSRNARSVWELCNERTKNGNLWPKTDPCFFSPLAPSCSSLWFFLLWEYRRRRGEDPGSVVGGQRSLTRQLLLLVQRLCLASFRLRSAMSSYITFLCLVSGTLMPYHWYQPKIPCPIISTTDEPFAIPQLAILLPNCLSSYPRPTTCKAKVNGKWMVVQVWSHFPNHLMTLSDCRRGRWSRWRRALWTFAREGKSEQSISRMCLSLWCLLVVVSDWWNKWWVIQPFSREHL